MKQLLIVKSGTTLNSGVTTGKDLSGLKDGAITFFNLDDNSLLSATPTKKFGIALGRPNNQLPFIIPEVDFSTLKVVKAEYTSGSKFTASVTIPTTVVDKEYTIIMVKKGTVPNERNLWSATHLAKGTSATDTAAALAKALNDMKETTNVNVNNTGATISFTGTKENEDWEIKGADGLFGTTVTVNSTTKPIGNKSYVEDLASRCAAGKGFTETMLYGQTTIPGYPETVENIKYNIYTLRFAVGRESGKTVDERVYQVVHIAVPKPDSGNDIVDPILGSGPTVAVED